MKIQRMAAVAAVAVCLAAGGSGCAKNNARRDDGAVGSTSAKRVPDSARRVAEATGSRLIHRALREGTVYVVDGENDKVIYSGPVRAGANVVVDPAADAITVNDQQVKAKVHLQPRHTYRLYFQQQG